MFDVAGYISRKTMLYKTNVEYGDYTMNHVLGCAHGCRYPCYAFLLKRRFGVINSYEDWLKPYLVKNTLTILDKEIPKLKNKIKSVHLCFTTDPFMYGYEEIKNMSFDAIEKLNGAGIKCTVLSKGILPDKLSSLSNKNEYGITLVSKSEIYREKYEIGSAKYDHRIHSLKRLHDLGCKTWVSIEPYPTPNIIDQNIGDILKSICFVDKIIFGRTNYSKEISSFKLHKNFYNMQSKEVMSFCKSNSILCHIKNGTITE